MTDKESEKIQKAIRRLEDKLDALMLGERGSGNGVLNRLTRIETVEEHRRWHFRAVWAAIVAVFAKFVFDLFRRGE